MDETTLLYQEGESVVADDGRRVVLRLPEGCDTTEGVIMQIEGDKIHIITQGKWPTHIKVGYFRHCTRLQGNPHGRSQ